MFSVFTYVKCIYHISGGGAGGAGAGGGSTTYTSFYSSTSSAVTGGGAGVGSADNVDSATLRATGTVSNKGNLLSISPFF